MWPPSFELVRSHRLELANLVIATWVMWFYVVRSAFVSYFYWPHAPVVIFIARCSDPQNVWTNPFSYIFSIFSIHGSGNDSFCEEPCFRAFACVYGQSCAVYPRYNWVLCSPSARVSFEWMCVAMCEGKGGECKLTNMLSRLLRVARKKCDKPCFISTGSSVRWRVDRMHNDASRVFIAYVPP